MSHDSIIQWRQIATNNIVDYQPALHTLFMWVITRISFSPALIAIVQIFILALSAGWFLKNIHNWGVSKVWIWTAAIIVACSPINIVLSITIWKDIPYTAIILIISGFMFLINSEKLENIILKKWNLIFLGILFSLAALFRWNGVIVSLSCIICITVFTRRWISTAYIFAVFLAIVFTVRGPVFSLLNIHTSDYIFYTLPLHHMGAFISEDVEFSEKEEVFLNQIAPLEDNWEYDCHAIRKAFGPTLGDNLIYNKSFLIENGKRFLNLYFKTLINNPVIYLNHLRCSAEFIWYPWASMERMQLKTVGGIRWIPYENEFGIKSDSKIPYFVNPVTKIIKATIFIWQPSLFLWLSVGVLLISFFYKKDKLILLFIPLLSQSIGIALLTNSQEFRYQYPVVFIGHFIWLILLKKNKVNKIKGI